MCFILKDLWNENTFFSDGLKLRFHFYKLGYHKAKRNIRKGMLTGKLQREITQSQKDWLDVPEMLFNVSIFTLGFSNSRAVQIHVFTILTMEIQLLCGLSIDYVTF